MHGFGPVVREENEPVFHADWEGRTAALMRSALTGRVFNIDEFRRTIERMPPASYLAATYYERWLYALQTLLLEKGVVSRAEHVSRKREAMEIRRVIPRKRQVPMRPQGCIAATKRRRRNRAASRFATTGITSRASRLATKSLRAT